jgi:adenine phosphoribosyltransferase
LFLTCCFLGLIPNRLSSQLRIIPMRTLSQNSILRAQQLIRDVPNFPKEGILFKDITPVLADPESMRQIIDQFIAFATPLKPDLIVGIESRGFVFGMPLAMELGIGFIPVRKKGKLPYDTVQEHYDLEYGTNTLEIHSDAIKPGQRVIICDDLLATGGTAQATCRLVERLEGVVCGLSFMVELDFLNGRAALEGRNIHSLIHF